MVAIALLGSAAGAVATGHLGGIQAWQWMLGVETVPALVYGLMAPAIPESPRYLIAAGHERGAREVLAEVEGAAVYACFALLSIPFAAYCIKETRGRTLEEMG